MVIGAAATRLGGNTMAEKAKHPAMIAFWLAAILLVTYSIAFIVAGHGVAPLALALVGDPDDWLPLQVLGWASIVGLVFVTIWFRHDPLKLAIWQLTASIFLYLSWFAFAYFGAGPTDRASCRSTCPPRFRWHSCWLPEYSLGKSHDGIGSAGLRRVRLRTPPEAADLVWERAT
jgi:hypothetical protein